MEAPYQLIEDTQADIVRREAEERQTLLGQLQAVAMKYGKSVEDFLNLPAAKAAGKKAAVKKAGPRSAAPAKAAPAESVQTGPSGDAASEGQP